MQNASLSYFLKKCSLRKHSLAFTGRVVTAYYYVSEVVNVQLEFYTVNFI